MRKKLNLPSHDLSVIFFLCSSAIVTLSTSLTSHFMMAKLNAVQATSLDALTASGVLGMTYSIMKILLIDRNPEIQNKPTSLKYVFGGAAVLGLAGALTAYLSYPHRFTEYEARQNVPLVENAKAVFVERKLPRGQTGITNLESATCKQFEKEYAYQADYFNGDDGLGGVVVDFKGDNTLRINCRNYIDRMSKNYPKPEKN